MGKLEFVQISDMHTLPSYEGSSLEGYCRAVGTTPVKSLDRLLTHIAENHKNLDFVMITGDLVHEASKENYTFVRDLIKRHLGDLPLVIALGNHDRRIPFRKVFFDEDSDAQHRYEITINETRIIVLDTSGNGQNIGRIEDDQLDWLRQTLAVPYLGGTIVVMHHVPSMLLEGGRFAPTLENFSDFHDAVRDTGVRAVFCGHIHQTGAAIFDGIPYFTADSTGFGMEVGDGVLRTTDKFGYNYCTMDDSGIHVLAKHHPDRMTRMGERPIPF